MILIKAMLSTKLLFLQYTTYFQSLVLTLRLYFDSLT